jgi:Ca2+-binding RTX toxin-like protein
MACVFDAADATLEVKATGNTDVVLGRTGTSPTSTVSITDAEGNTAPCSGGTPTVSQFDSLEFVPDSSRNAVEIDLENGYLAPGLTPETSGESEIEISLLFVEGVNILGSAGPDDLRVIGSDDRSKVRLNAEMDRDADLFVRSGDLTFVGTELGPGDDHLKTVRGFINFAFGGAGNDTMAGGSSIDFFLGGGGADLLNGARSTDLLIGGAGRDRVIGGRGPDLLRTRGGGKDRVSCGRGRDLVQADRADRKRGCELGSASSAGASSASPSALRQALRYLRRR